MPGCAPWPAPRGSPSRISLDPARRAGATLPALVCASDGNHGLAVATAARLAGARARVYLPAIVPDARVARIAVAGAEAIRVPGTYEDAVRRAAEAARGKEGVLVPPTPPRTRTTRWWAT
ncbi:MAG: pyridoxal-phosphate dependent enzyme [Nitrospira sp.]